MNEKIVESLIKGCKNMLKNIYYADYYEEILEKVSSSNCSMEDKIELLTQLYRYGYYNNVQISLDPKINMHTRHHILTNIGEAADKGNTEEYINIIVEDINKMRDHIDNPVSLIEKEIEFSSKHPGAKF